MLKSGRNIESGAASVPRGKEVLSGSGLRSGPGKLIQTVLVFCCLGVRVSELWDSNLEDIDLATGTTEITGKPREK
jgi:hypothetical protein